MSADRALSLLSARRSTLARKRAAPAADLRSDRSSGADGIEAGRLAQAAGSEDAMAKIPSSDRIDQAAAEMQAFLNRLHPASDAEALQSLRLAFPAVPLSDRVAAISRRFFI